MIYFGFLIFTKTCHFNCQSVNFLDSLMLAIRRMESVNDVEGGLKQVMMWWHTQLLFPLYVVTLTHNLFLHWRHGILKFLQSSLCLSEVEVNHTCKQQKPRPSPTLLWWKLIKSSGVTAVSQASGVKLFRSSKQQVINCIRIVNFKNWSKILGYLQAD